MKRTIAGIDIGSHTTRVVICDVNPNSSAPRIRSTAQTKTVGVRHGYITEHEDVIKTLSKAFLQAESAVKTKINALYVSLGGLSLDANRVRATVNISRKDGEVSIIDTEQILEKAEDILLSRISNRRILHGIPLQYKVDENIIFGDPIGITGEKLQVEVLFISCFNHHYDSLLDVVQALGIKEIHIIAEPLATSMAVLTSKQKTLGCILANIGAETISISVFEEGDITSLDVFSIGSTDITSDIALGFQISLEEAESVKIGEAEKINQYPKKRIDQIIEARLADIFELIDKHLKAMKKQKLLPGGIILVGGGSALTDMEIYAREALQLPSSVVNKKYLEKLYKEKDTKINNSTITAYGACFMAAENTIFQPRISSKKFFKNIKNKLSILFEQFIP